MTDEPHHLDIAATINRMEKGIAPIPIEMSLASIAISLKEISGTLVDIHMVMQNTERHVSMLNSEISSYQSYRRARG